MNSPLLIDEDLVRRLPLPLAQLYRRAHNAKSPLERHLTAFYLWEAALKLLASAAVVEYAERPEHDPQLAERLQSLARPALGHWWEYVRLLVPALADGGDAGFAAVHDLVLGATRDDLPRCAGLDAVLRQELEGKGGARASVRLTELFDRLVTYRNKVLGHAAPGQLRDDFNERMAGALLAAAAELLGRLDTLAGRRLVYVAEVRQVGGVWLVQRYELTGESARRIESPEVPRDQADRLPDGERVYLLSPLAPGGRGVRGEGPLAPLAPGGRGVGGEGPFSPLAPRGRGVGGEGEGPLRSLHPLLLYDAEADAVHFLNARRGKRRTEYLCYTTGHTADRADLCGEQRRLLARVLGMAVEEGQAVEWAARSEAEEPPAEEPPGPARRLLGEFELLSELGRGGMGVVYRAWQPSLGRQVALKCLSRAGDPKAEARFRREIRALGHVEHPHLVKVFTSGSEGDQWFYVMELVEGATLAAVCDKLSARSSAADVDAETWQAMLDTACAEARRAEKPLSDGGVAGAERSDAPERQTGASRTQPRPPEHGAGRSYIRDVARLLRQVAEAAHALHEAGVVHRDIKPGNIMVSADGGQATLMDLGLAQLADDVEGRLTRTRQFVGTLRYASPQQVLAVAKLDRRSDVYSLGATLWELLTLRPLYGATDKTPTPELMERIQRQEPERPRRYNPAIPRDLEAVVLKCLEKDPAGRYATAGDLAEDLGRFLEGEPVVARPVSGVERGLRWARRHPAAAGLLAASGLALLALAVGGVGWYYETRLRESNRDLQAALDDASQQRELAEQAQEKAEAAQQREAEQRKRAEDALQGEKIQRARAEGLLYSLSIERAHSDWREKDIKRADDILKTCNPELRKWEWGYVYRLCHSDLLTLQADANRVFGVAYSPDGTRLASASFDGTVKVWDAQTGQQILTLQGHTGAVFGVGWSADCRRLASASFDKTVRVWDARTGQEALSLKGHGDAVYGVAFSPDGSRLASASCDKTVKVWDARSGREALTLQGHTDLLYGVAWSPDGKRLASASLDKTIKVWDAQAGQELLTLRGHTAGVRGVAWSPDGTRLASASADWTVKVWDAQTGRRELSLQGHGDWILGVAWSPDGRRLASASNDKTVKVWDTQTGQEALALQGHTNAVWGVAWSADGTRLASASADGTAKVWDARTQQEALALQGHTDGVLGVAWSPDGARLASASFDKTVKVWDAKRGGEALSLKGHSGPVRGVSWSADGTRLASASDDKTVKVWDAKWPCANRQPSSPRGLSSWGRD